tara:strand:+ start:97 stop:561 length:465 start_codon:yes stop_codon:yes gene_type:complete
MASFWDILKLTGERPRQIRDATAEAWTGGNNIRSFDLMREIEGQGQSKGGGVIGDAAAAPAAESNAGAGMPGPQGPSLGQRFNNAIGNSIDNMTGLQGRVDQALAPSPIAQQLMPQGYQDPGYTSGHMGDLSLAPSRAGLQNEAMNYLKLLRGG